MADALIANVPSILAANQKDLDSSGLAGAMRDRLLLTPERIAGMVAGVREVASLPDPVGETITEWTRPNGLRIRKVRVPLGVVGSRLRIASQRDRRLRFAGPQDRQRHRLARRQRSGPQQPAIGRDSESAWTGVPEGAIELLDSSTRDSVHELIKARGLVDVLIPRGGPGLISLVADNATVPVIETGAGNCHIFVDESADFEMADEHRDQRQDAASVGMQRRREAAGAPAASPPSTFRVL